MQLCTESLLSGTQAEVVIAARVGREDRGASETEQVIFPERLCYFPVHFPEL